MHAEHDARLAEFERWRKSWVRRAIFGYGVILVAGLIGMCIVANVAQNSNELSQRVEARSHDFCEATKITRNAARSNAQLANDGLRSISPAVPPSAATREVIAARQELRRDLETVNCDRYFRDEAK
jgi:outer membrane murein-binding lipoprotein Lpp